MLILHLVPVGLSLLDQMELPDSAITVRDAMPWAATGPTRQLDWDRLAKAGVSRLPPTADTEMAAEWTSVAAVNREPSASVDGEAFVFIATDTDDGLRAATMVAARYERSAVRYLHEPLTAGSPGLEPGDVYVCRIPDLDLGKRPPNSITWRSLGAVGRLAADAATQSPRGEWQVIVHLSGGYKAMIPYLMMMAESVNSRLRDVTPGAPRRRPIRAVAIHHSSLEPGATAAPVVIDIPVRAIEGDLLRDVEGLAKVARPDSDIVGDDVSDYLLGLFVDDGRLTPAGLIMVNVL